LNQAIHLNLKRGFVINQMAYAYSIHNDDLNAIKYLRKIFDNNYAPLNADGVQKDIAKHYLKLQKLDSAEFFAVGALEYSLDKGLLKTIYESHDLLNEIETLKKNYAKALEHANFASLYKDSVFFQDSDRRITSLTAQLETLDKINEINKLKLQAELSNIEKRMFIVAIAFLLVTIFILVSRHKLKIRVHKLEAHRIEREYEMANKSLQSQTLQMIRMNNNFEEIEKNLLKLKSKINISSDDIHKLIYNLNVSKNMEKEWNSFNHAFSQLHSDFYSELNRQFSNLTVNEIRLCALIRMNMTNSEISSLLNGEPNSVRMAKYRLKKRFNLDEDANLLEFIASIGQEGNLVLFNQ
ncbi:MAG: hypothetical protein RLO12_16520, partial [Fulvivirga sp.]